MPSTPAGPSVGPSVGAAPEVVGSAAARSEEHRRKSLSTRPKDMLISMTVIVGIVLVLLLIVPRPNKIPERNINVASAAQGAQSTLGFTPANPQVPAGWTARAAGLELKTTDDSDTWQVTYTTPTGTYVGIQQAKNATKAWESRQVTDGQEAGTESVGGIEWINRSRTDRGMISLVNRGTDGITTVVTGTADQAQMDQFATAVAADLK
jgi:hypothetical protein